MCRKHSKAPPIYLPTMYYLTLLFCHSGTEQSIIISRNRLCFVSNLREFYLIFRCFTRA